MIEAAQHKKCQREEDPDSKNQFSMAIISQLIGDATFEYFCLVDSAEQVELLGNFFKARKQRLNVLLELGVDDGRTGVRNQQQLDAVLASLSRWRGHLACCGIEVYEGVLKDEQSIRKFLQDAASVTNKLARGNHFDRTPIILSGAGSAWYDVVAEIFSKAAIDQALEVVLRPGCYLTHAPRSFFPPLSVRPCGTAFSIAVRIPWRLSGR